MKYSKAVKIRVAAAVVVLLGVIAVYHPKTGVPLVIVWLVVTGWLSYRQWGKGE